MEEYSRILKKSKKNAVLPQRKTHRQISFEKPLHFTNIDKL